MTALPARRAGAGPPVLIAACALPVAFLAGAALARDVPLGIAFLLAVTYAPLVLINLPLGVVLWIPLTFLVDLQALRFGPTLAGMLIVFGWFGTLVGHRSPTLARLRDGARYIVLMWAFLLFVLLTVAWSKEPAPGSDVGVSWLMSGCLYMILITALIDRRHMQLAVVAFIVGAVLSVFTGLVDTGLQGPQTATETAVDPENRLGGGAGDPNYLAAGIVPAIILAFGLAGSTERMLVRWACLVAVGFLTVGFAAAQSRGGLVAAVLAGGVAFAIFKRRRAHLLGVLLLVVGILAAWFSLNPDAWQRISSFDASGTGRTDLWSVAWQMGLDHPVVGVGLENFVVQSPTYAAEKVGALDQPVYTDGVPKVAHNAYVQMFAELGLVGLALFLAVVFFSLRAGLRAAKRFDLAGDGQMATLARSAVLGSLGALAASFFVSNAHDRRTWILLALGPAFLGLSRHSNQTLHDHPRRPGAPHAGAGGGATAVASSAA